MRRTRIRYLLRTSGRSGIPEAGAVIGQLPDPVQHQIYELLSDGVVSPGVVVGGVLLARDQLLRVEQLPVRSGAHFVDNSGLEIHKHGPGNVLSRPGFAEEGVERVVSPTNGLVRWHLTVWLDSVLQTVELPAGVANLHSGLPNMD